VTSHQKFRRALEESLESEAKVQQILDTSQDIEVKKQIIKSSEIRISEQTKQSLGQYREELREKQAYAEKHDPTQTQQYRKNTYLEVQAALGTLSEDIDRAIEEDRDLESIARSIESRELARETGKEMRELKSLKKRLQDLIKKEKIVEEMLQKIEKLGETVGGLENIIRAGENRVETVELVLEHAEERNDSPSDRLVRQVIEEHSNNGFSELEKNILKGLGIYDQRTDSLESVIFCPTLSKGSMIESARNTSLAGYLLALRDHLEDSESCLESLRSEDYEGVEEIKEAYINAREIAEDEGFDIFQSNYRAYYVSPGEFKIASRGEIVINKMPESYLSELDDTPDIKETLQAKASDLDIEELTTTYLHERQHHIISMKTDNYSFIEAKENITKSEHIKQSEDKQKLLIDEGAAFAVNLVRGQEINPDPKVYNKQFGLEPDWIESVAKALATDKDGNTEEIRSIGEKAVRYIDSEEREEFLKNTLSESQNQRT
jgi:hypothetical protein